MNNNEKIRFAINQIAINNCDGSANEKAIKSVRYLQEVSETLTNMKLKEFIEKFVERNTLIRLWYKTQGGHELVNDPKMEWELAKDETYSNSIVIGVTDIVISGPYTEAVNISIEDDRE